MAATDSERIAPPPLISVFGGSGFLGRAVTRTLAAAGMRVRVVARHPWRSEMPTGAEFFRGDIRDEQQVVAALQGAWGAVNAVSLYVEPRGGPTFEDIHVIAAERLARCVRETGVRRLVHISGIGVNPHSPSSYVRARTAGEARVRETLAEAITLRPSVLFGRDDAFLSALAQVARLPFAPLFGHGDTRLQPVHVDDVAAAVGQALQRDDTRGRIYELGGATVHRYRDLVRIVQEHYGHRRPLLPVPFAAWRALGALAAMLPNPPLTRDQVMLMEADNVVGTTQHTFASLGIAPSAIEDRLDECLGSRR